MTAEHGVGFVIRDIYAWLAVHADGDEGVTSFTTPNGMTFPMIAADPTRLDQLRPIAEEIAATTGKTLRLVRFTHREEVEIIGAPPQPDRVN